MIGMITWEIVNVVSTLKTQLQHPPQAHALRTSTILILVLLYPGAAGTIHLFGFLTLPLLVVPGESFIHQSQDLPFLLHVPQTWNR